MRRGRRLSRREVESEFPGALHELPSGEEPEFSVTGDSWTGDAETLFVRFADNSAYSWSPARGWFSEP